MLVDKRASLVLLKGLKGLGVRLSLDDFSTELTALSCPHTYHRCVEAGEKIVNDLPEKQLETATITAIPVLTKELGTQVCVEDVERMEQLTLLTRRGGEAMLGFFLDALIDSEEMNQRLKENNVL